MSTPNDIKIKTFSDKDDRKYIEIPCSSINKVHQFTLNGYGTDIAQNINIHFASKLCDTGVTPLDWYDGAKYQKVFSPARYGLLNTYKIIDAITDIFVNDYKGDSKNINKRLIEYKRNYFSRWGRKIISTALKEVIDSFKIKDDVLKLHKRMFAVLGPEYSHSPLLGFIFDKDTDDQYATLYNSIIYDKELSNILVYLGTYDNYIFLQKNEKLTINKIMDYFFYDRPIKNKKVVEYCLINIPTSLPIMCMDNISNLGKLNEPIFGRIEYKFLLSSRIVNDIEKCSITSLTKSDIKFLTKTFFSGKMNYPTLVKIRNAFDLVAQSSYSLDDAVIKMGKYLIEGGSYI